MEASNNRPRVSVIMPAYNAAAHVAGAIDSVLAQGYRRWELLIVDDGSRDETAAIAGRYAAAHRDRITLLHHAERANRGVAASRNLAVEQARGEYVAFLDADDLWRTAKLAEQVAMMEAHPEMGLSYALSGILRDGSDSLFMPGLREYGSHLPGAAREAFMAIALGRVHYAFSSVMARRDAILAVGGFDRDLRFQNEDRLLAAKVAALYRVGRLPDVLCDYRAHAASYSSRAAQRKLTPLLFLDVQVRLLRWLRQPGRPHALARALAAEMLPRQAMPGLLDACADPAMSKIATELLWEYFLAAPVRGAQAALRVLRRMAGARRAGDRERSLQELQDACERVTLALQQAGLRRVVLYGAGQHTQRVLQGRHLASCTIVGILDDGASHREVMGIPVFRPSDFRSEDDVATVISSDTQQSRLFEKAKQHGLKSVYRLYP